MYQVFLTSGRVVDVSNDIAQTLIKQLQDSAIAFSNSPIVTSTSTFTEDGKPVLFIHLGKVEAVQKIEPIVEAPKNSRKKEPNFKPDWEDEAEYPLPKTKG